MIAPPIVNDRAATMAQLPLFVEAVNAMRQAYYDKNFGSDWTFEPVTIGKGRKYIRLWTGSSIFCFIRVADGAVLKAATWKAPALNHSRGSIFDPKVTNAVGVHGANYMK